MQEKEIQYFMMNTLEVEALSTE